jgi:magnesium chelatase family protein
LQHKIARSVAPQQAVFAYILTYDSGVNPRPGEVSLAHRGVLFLDELPEFKKHVLEVLRQPLEDGRVTISRAAQALTYPADFMLVAAMNPCPCGYLTDDRHVCSCQPLSIHRYRSRISGPLMDRIDLQVEVPAVPYEDLKAPRGTRDSATMRAGIVKVRAIQAERYKGSNIRLNADLQGALLERWCKVGEAEHSFLEQAVRRLGLSARAYTRVLRIARTIADMEDAEHIEIPHLAEAINFRTMDRVNAPQG